MERVHLTTSEELCKKANNVDYGLRHEEPPRFTFWAKFTEKLKEFRFIWRF